MTASKKVRRDVQFRILFLFSSFSLLQQGPRKGDTPKRILPREGTRLRASLLIRGSKAGPRKGSIAASDRVGPTPTTGQRFEGRPLRRVPRPPQATRAPRPLLIRGSKAGPRRVQQSPQIAWARHPLLVRGSKAGPPKGSMAASGYSGSAPITDQGFKGWPPKGSQPPQTPSEG